MFKCKEQVPKYNPQSLSTLSFIKCYNNNININCTATIKFKSEPVQVIYKDFCLTKNCYQNNIHLHIEESREHLYWKSKHSEPLYHETLVNQILPFEEFSSNQVDERRRRAVKRKLFE